MDNIAYLYGSAAEQLDIEERLKTMEMLEKENELLHRKILRKEKIINELYSVIRKRTLFIGVLVCISLTLIFTIGFIISKWNKTQAYSTYIPEGYTQTFSSYYIEGGDTIDSITRQWLIDHPETAAYISFNIQKREILRLNRIHNSDKITQGNYIILPYIIESELDE